MSDAKNKTTEQGATDIGRRKAVTYLALGLGLGAAAVLAPKRAEAGYGRCYKCSCCTYEGQQNQCANCGHNYEDHYNNSCGKGK
jgi:hypothetical protein